MRKHGIIYKAISPSGKVYVGQTTQTLRARKKGHKTTSLNKNNQLYNTHFSRALRKYGVDGFSWEMLYNNIPVDYLDSMEIFIISMYDSFNNGYNSTAGGSGSRNRVVSEEERKAISERQSGKNNSFYGKTHTEETKRRLSEVSSSRTGDKHHSYGKPLSEEHKKKLSERLSGENHPFYGKTLSEETRRKISEARTGSVMDEETKSKISKTMSKKYLGEGNPFYGKTHSEESKKKIAKSVKLLIKTDEQKAKIAESNRRTKRAQARKTAKPFVVIKDDVVIGEWLLAVECAEDLGLRHDAITHCLNKKRKTHKDFRFIYKEDVR